MKFKLFITILLYTNICLAQRDSISVNLDYCSPGYQGTVYLTIADAIGNHFQVESNTCVFALKLRRGKYYFTCYAKDKIIRTDTVDLSKKYYPTFGTWRIKYELKNEIKNFNVLKYKYVDTNQSLWTIKVNYVNEFSNTDTSIDVSAHALSSTINWNGYCCRMKNEKKLSDSIRRNVKQLFSKLDSIEKISTNLKTDSAIVIIENYVCTFYYNKNKKFESCIINIYYDKLIDCYIKYLYIEEYLDKKYKFEKAVYSSPKSRGIGKIYSANSSEISLQYGFESEKEIIIDKYYNTKFPIPRAVNFFVNISFRKGK